MKENYNTIELLFDLPRRLKNIDNKIKILSIYSWDEENSERLFNKIIDMKLLRNRLYNKYAILVNAFNQLKSDTRNILVAVFMKDMPISKVSTLTNTKERTIYRRFERVEEILNQSLKGEQNEQVL